MSEEFVTPLDNIERKIDNLARPEITRHLVQPFLNIPGKVGVWYAGDVQRSTGNIYDRSNQARTLTYNGNPTFNQLDNGIAYADLDGTGDYWSRADETDLDILGTETIYNSSVRGLTMGGWFFANTTPVVQVGLIAKWGAPGNRSYWLNFTNTGLPSFTITTDGSTQVTISHATSYTNATWLYCVGRFIPSTEVAIWHNDDKDTNTTSIPASVHNGTQGLAIGETGGGGRLTGRMSICFLSANALPDALIHSLFRQTRSLFGV